MKKLLSMLSVVVLLAAAGVLVFDQNPAAADTGISIDSPKNGQIFKPGDKITISGVVDGVRRLGPANKLSIRVGSHELPVNFRRNRFTSEFEVSKSIKPRRFKPRRLYRGGHGVIYIFGRVKVGDQYYFDRVKVRVDRRKHKKSKDGLSL